MNMRVQFDGDNWCCRPEFFIRAALFNDTANVNWTIVSLGPGEWDNKTDGAFHHRYWVYQIAGEKWEGDIRRIDRVDIIPPFDVRGNIYSYQSIFKGALGAGTKKRTVCILDKNVSDDRALPVVLREFW